MDRTRLLARLDAHQESVVALLREVEPLLSDEAQPDVAALARARWTMLRTLTGYQYFKHHDVFDPAIARALFGQAARAERLKAACLAIGEAYRAHVSTWSARDVAGDWATFRPAALSMVDRLRRHVATEREEIAALLTMAA